MNDLATEEAVEDELQRVADVESANPTFTLPWRTVATILSSPFVRVAALVPLVGYLIIYGDAFQDWFNLSSIGSSLFLSGELRLRLFYYGGLMVLTATMIYWLAAPSLIKRFTDETQLRDYFFTSARPSDIEDAIDSLRSLNANRSSGSGLEYAFREKLLQFNKLTAAKIGDEREHRSLEKMIAVAKRGVAKKNRIIEKNKFEVLAYELVRLNYRYSQGCRNFARRGSYACAVIGIFLTLIPAVETLFMVLIIDFG